MRKVFVALSGGVDSAVAAHILKTDGWDVTAVFIRVWQPAFLACSQDAEERAALRVAAHLGIPFKKLDLSDVYKKEVVDEMISEYKKGRTPNPDVLCNSSVKFGALLEYAKENGADKIATGHHAQVTRINDQKNNLSSPATQMQLLRGADKSKDQVYFLWKLNQEELGHTLMPIGHMSKDEVRDYAKEHSIPSALKPDSQGLCFIGHVDMKTFLKNFINTEPGNVLNEDGEVIGSHDGSELITIGQRGGFQITEKNTERKVKYVVLKNVKANTVTVSDKQNLSQEAKKEILLIDTNWIHPISESAQYTCEIRYHGEALACTVLTQNAEATLILEKETLVAKGQSVVVYNDGVCLGGGIVA